MGLYKNQSMMRADLSGGVLDIWPLYLILKNCTTVQLSLKKYSAAVLETRPRSSTITVKIKSPPGRRPSKDIVLAFDSKEDFLRQKSSSLALIQSFVQYFNTPRSFKIEISSESPLGAGLGGSSSLSVSLLKCFSSAANTAFNFIDSIQLCRDLETQVLKKPAGIQDYIIPLQKKEYPWINIIELTPLKPKIQSIPFPKEILKQHLLIIDSQISHHSGNTNWRIVQNALNETNLNELQECRDISLEMAQSCRTKKFENWPYLFEKEYQCRKHIQDTPKKAEEIKDYLRSRGAQGVKFMGAGSGGCMLIWTNDKEKLKQNCLQEGISLVEDFQ